jgi:mono/diheme cytochrome c family protein
LVGLSAARATRPNWRIFWHYVGAVWMVLFAVLYLAGCETDHPFHQPLVLPGRTVEARTLNRGRDVYQQYCRPCHGDHGDGRGFSSLGLRPPPRDFTQALFKFGHVPSPALPPDAELARIVRLGLDGTAMLPWDLPDDELDAVLSYLKTFSPLWRSQPPGQAIVAPPDPFGAARAAEAAARGDKLFHEIAQCARCHEQRDLRDTEFCLDRECAHPVRQVPPDLACDPLRTVFRTSELVDLYRIIAAGIGGTGMPTWKGALPDDELWALAYYVQRLRQAGCKPSRTGQ